MKLLNPVALGRGKSWLNSRETLLLIQLGLTWSMFAPPTQGAPELSVRGLPVIGFVGLVRGPKPLKSPARMASVGVAATTGVAVLSLIHSCDQKTKVLDLSVL